MNQQADGMVRICSFILNFVLIFSYRAWVCNCVAGVLDIADAFLAGSVAHSFLDNHDYAAPSRHDRKENLPQPEYTSNAFLHHRPPSNKSKQQQEAFLYNDRGITQQYDVAGRKERFLDDFGLSSSSSSPTSQISKSLSQPQYQATQQPMAFRGLASSSSLWDTSSEEDGGVTRQARGLIKDALYAV